MEKINVIKFMPVDLQLKGISLNNTQYTMILQQCQNVLTRKTSITNTLPCGVVTVTIDTLSNTGLDVAV